MYYLFVCLQLLQYKQKCEELESKVELEKKHVADKQSKVRILTMLLRIVFTFEGMLLQLEQTVSGLQGQLSAANQRLARMRESHSEELHAALIKVDEEQKRLPIVW